MGATLGVVAIIAACGTFAFCNRQNKGIFGEDTADALMGSYVPPSSTNSAVVVRPTLAPVPHQQSAYGSPPAGENPQKRQLKIIEL